MRGRPMTESVERLVSVKDLSSIVVECVKCKARLTLDPHDRRRMARLSLRASDNEMEHPFDCPMCAEPFATKNTRVAFGALCEFFYHAKDLPDEALRIRLLGVSYTSDRKSTRLNSS